MNYSETFPVLKNYTYLNTANSGLLPAPSVHWRQQHDAGFMEGGSIFRMKNLEVMEQLRTTLSESFSLKRENTFLIPNFSSGFNSILNGIGKNHRFLLLEEDYPTINYAITCRGFEFLEIPIVEGFEQNIINSIEKFKPTVFAFSMVQYISGIRMQGDFIKQLKVIFPELILIADGTQFLGTTAFSFDQSGLDMLAGSGYKWLLGGYGNGYVFLSDRLKNIVYEDRKQSILPTFLTGRDYLSLSLEPGHLDSLNFGSLNQGINYLNALSLDFIEKTNQEISNKARMALQAKGLLADWLIERKEQSTIISIPLEKETVMRLDAENIICSLRGDLTRVSFNFYNTEEDLNRFLEVLLY